MTLRGPADCPALPRLPHLPGLPATNSQHTIRWDPILGARKEGFTNEFEIGMGWPQSWPHMEASVLVCWSWKANLLFLLCSLSGDRSDLAELTRSRCEERKEKA